MDLLKFFWYFLNLKLPQPCPLCVEEEPGCACFIFPSFPLKMALPTPLHQCRAAGRVKNPSPFLQPVCMRWLSLALLRQREGSCDLLLLQGASSLSVVSKGSWLTEDLASASSLSGQARTCAGCLCRGEEPAPAPLAGPGGFLRQPRDQGEHLPALLLNCSSAPFFTPSLSLGSALISSGDNARCCG